MKLKFMLLIISSLLLTACAAQPDTSSPKDSSITEPENISDSENTEADTESSDSKESNDSTESKDINTESGEENMDSAAGGSYTMSFYTEAPNKNSTIKIQYPSFSGADFDTLNTLIYDKVQSFAEIDTELFSSDVALTIDYQSAVTLHNNKIVSLIFWGSSNIEGSAYPTTNLFSFNVELDTMKEVALEELYNTNEDFTEVFFDKAFFPTNPITSYDEASFPEMLKLQTPEYQTVDPFSIQGNVSYFLKDDGIVLSMPAVHATGSDHLEAQLKYSDIQKFYLLKQNYWED